MLSKFDSLHGIGSFAWVQSSGLLDESDFGAWASGSVVEVQPA